MPEQGAAMRVLTTFALAMLVSAPAVADDQPSAPADPKVEWVSKPTRELSECFRIFDKGEKVREGVVVMRCSTAPKDHIGKCAVTSTTEPDDERYSEVAICAAQFFRMRATGANGKPVMGVPVNVPFRFAAGSEELLKQAGKPPQ